MEMNEYKHWSVQVDQQQYLWAELSRCDAPANSMNDDVLDELNAIIDQAATRRGLVIQSGKKNGFILGADINSFTAWDGAEEAMRFIRKGQSIYQRLSELTIPTVALIQGYCLGGGMELALACQYRVVDDSDKTRFGLPEIKLGIFPAWGGSVRLPKLVGALNALDLMMTGRMVRAKAAKRMGLVDAVVPARHIKTAVSYYLQERPAVHKASFVQQLSNTKFVRPLIAWKARKDLKQKRVKQAHYPAFFALLDLFEKNNVNSPNALRKEAEAIQPILERDSAMNLVRVFQLQERLKGFAKGIDYKAKHVHVVGAGVMGAEIAAVCAAKGLKVTLQDREHKFIAPAIKQAYGVFKKKLKTPRAVEKAMDLLIPDVDGRGVSQADVIIEAIYENLEAKQSLFKQLESQAKPEAILATNTSTFPLAEISTAMASPERLVGIHFFNPVSKMPLVEVVIDSMTDSTVVEHSKAFVGQIDKLPLPVKSSPGFLVNRVLMPYLMECVDLVDEGVAPESIDKAATDFGMPMGPVELADKVGLDICLSAAESLSKHFTVKIPSSLRNKVQAGDLGLKSGKGFYEYVKGKPKRDKKRLAEKPSADIADRLILRLVNEAVACLRESVVEDADLVDAGMIFGTGFAPFRGGPMHYSDTEGFASLEQKLCDFERRYGDRFNPDTGWESLATQE